MKKKTGLAILLALLLTAAVCFAFFSMFIVTGGKVISVRAEEVDLAGRRLSGITPLLRLSSPSRIDLRGCRAEAEDVRQLAGHFPDCVILWDVPLSCGRFASDSREITLTGFAASDLELMGMFTDLELIDTRSFVLPEELLEALRSAVPGCRVLHSVTVGGTDFDAGSERLVVEDSSVSAEELLAQLREFPDLQEADLRALDLSVADQLLLHASLPRVHFIWNVSLCGQTIPGDAASLVFEQTDETAVAELMLAAPLLGSVQSVSLGETLLSPETVAGLRSALNGAAVHCMTEAFDRTFSTDEEELDFSGTEIHDTSLFDTLVPAMSRLKKVVLCDCGIADGEMDRLNHRYEGVRFVWTVYFSIYSCRTDSDNFCASNVPERNYIGINMNDQQIYPIRYCTDLVALDLGHMTLMTDLSILENMKQLRFLIIGTSGIKGDISVLAGLPELYYLELFHNTVNDLSPLLACKKLAHLNIGYCTGYDIAPLLEMKQLQRLWIPGNSLTDEQKAQLEEALPDTMIYMPRGDASGSTGGGWRENEAYYEMRDILHMHYMRGDAGYHLNDSGES